MSKISVIVPTFEPQDYIYECLESLNNQTLDKNLFEVIIILNGNKDPYLENLKMSIEKYNLDIKILYSQIIGVSNARNIGLSNTNYEYICFLDDDDIISSNYLECLLSRSKEDCITVSNFLCFQNKIENSYKDYIGIKFEKIKGVDSQDIVYMRQFLSTACGKLIPTKIIRDVRFDINHIKGEDSLFMATISNNIISFKTTPDNVIYYRRVRENSLSKKKKSLIIRLIRRYRLIKSYFKLLLQPNYNKIFVFTRILAQIKNLFL